MVHGEMEIGPADATWFKWPREPAAQGEGDGMRAGRQCELVVVPMLQPARVERFVVAEEAPEVARSGKEVA